jgi:hypothetical protein
MKIQTILVKMRRTKEFYYMHLNTTEMKLNKTYN